MQPQGQTIGIPWYRQDDYERLRAMFKDGWKLPDTFDDWLASAQAKQDELAWRGELVERAYIDPKTFPEWCRLHHQEMDEEGRMAYANECAASKTGAYVT
jgi:hypothetical protein